MLGAVFSGLRVSKPHLFLIESQLSACRALEMSLRDAGYTVTATVDLDVARSLLEEVRPAFILADLDHTHGTGIDFCAELRRSPAHRDSVILAMTQRNDLALRVKAVDLQIFDFFEKPVLVGEVVTRLRTLSNRAQYSTILRASSRSKLAGDLGETTPYDLLSTVSRGGRSAVLTCGTAIGPFFCWFTEGELTDAQLGHLHGDDSVHAFLGERRGHYEIEFRDVRRARSVSDSLPSILEAALERIDSWNELLETLPPMESVLRPADGISEAHDLAEDPVVRELARRAEKRATVESLLQSEQPRDLARAAALSKMYFYGLLEVTEEEPGEEEDDDSLTSLERWEEDHVAADVALVDEEAPARQPARIAAVSTKSDLPPAPDFVAGVDGDDDPDDGGQHGVEDEEAAAVSVAPGSYVDVDAVPVAATDPEAWRPSDDPSYVDVDHIGAPPPRDGEVPQSRLEAVRDAIRRSQIEELDGADASPTTTPHSTGEEDLELRADEIPSRDPVSQLGERAEAILEADDDEPLLATHTDPYPPEEGELADFSGLNDPGGLEDWDPPLEEVSTFGASAPVLTGPMAEESMVGLAVVAHGVEPAVRGTPRSRSESGELHEQRNLGDPQRTATDDDAVKINRAGVSSELRSMEVDISHARPSGLSGRTLAESGADFNRLRTMAGIETDTVRIRSGHRPAHESMREAVVSEDVGAGEEVLNPTANDDDDAGRRVSPRVATRTRVGLPPPTVIEEAEPAASQSSSSRSSSPVASASTSAAAIPRELPSGEESASVSMYDMISAAPSWWTRRWIWLVFGLATVGAVVAFTVLLDDGSVPAPASHPPAGVEVRDAQRHRDAATTATDPAMTADPAATTGPPRVSADAKTTSSGGATTGAEIPETGTSGATTPGSDPSSSGPTGDAEDEDTREDTSSTGPASDPATPEEAVETTTAGRPEEKTSDHRSPEPISAVAANPESNLASETSAGQEPSAELASEHFDSATRLFDRGKYGLAHEEIEQALKLDGGWPEALLLSAKIHLEEGRFQNAMTVARRVTLVAPGLVQAHIVIGVAEEALGSDEGAVAAYERFLLIAPTHPYATSIRKELKRLGAEPSR